MIFWSSCLYLIALVHKTISVTTYGGFNFDGARSKEGSYVGEKIEKGFFGTKCKYSILGRGVEDTWDDNCASNVNDYSRINSNRYFALIYKNNNPLSLYTDTYGTLVVVKGKECTLKKYKKNKSAPTVSKLDSKTCNKIKSKITEELNKLEEYWRKWKINHARSMKGQPPAEIIYDPLENQPATPSLYAKGAAGSEESSGPNKPYFTSAHFKTTELGQCVLTIVLEGRGVVDSLTTPCSSISDPQMVHFKEGIVIGNPDKDLFSVISDRWGEIVIVSGGKCTKKTFTSNNGAWSVFVSDVEDPDCEAIKKKMVKERKSFINYWRTRVANIKQTFRNLFSFKLW